MTIWPSLYRGVTAAASPLIAAYLRRRCRRGKEDAERLGERFGIASMMRPAAPLLWVHAASVGETVSLLGLVDRVLRERPVVEVLMTTGTVAAARMLEERLPRGARHQYVPIDTPRAVGRFLDHWHPDLAIWVESELWPNLVLETRRRDIPLLLANGRLSAGSLARWQKFPGLVQLLLGGFAMCLAQDETQAERFRQLGAGEVESVGDLKSAAAPLAADAAALAALQSEIAARPVWLAASTHPGEDEIIAAAHEIVARQVPGLLTIIAPRHPIRGPGIARMIETRGLQVARRAGHEPIAPDIEVYVADTLGELGLFYRTAGVAFIGGSLVRKGGHNPFEAARLDSAILHGPDMTNCAAMTDALDAAGAAEQIDDAGTLATAVLRLLSDPAERHRRVVAASRVAAASNGVLDAVLDRFAPWLDALAPPVTPAAAVPARRRAAGADARP